MNGGCGIDVILLQPQSMLCHLLLVVISHAIHLCHGLVSRARSCELVPFYARFLLLYMFSQQAPLQIAPRKNESSVSQVRSRQGTWILTV